MRSFLFIENYACIVYYKWIKCLRGYLQCCTISTQLLLLLGKLFKAEFQWLIRETVKNSTIVNQAKWRVILKVLQLTSQEVKTVISIAFKHVVPLFWQIAKLGKHTHKWELLWKVIGNHPIVNSEVIHILFRLMAIKVFECLQFFYESLILVLKDCNSVFETFHILLLLPSTLFCSLSMKVTKSLTIRQKQQSLQSCMYMKQTSNEHNIDNDHQCQEDNQLAIFSAFNKTLVCILRWITG